MCWWSLKSYSGSETCLSKATNVIMVPHQDQVFDNPSALCLALWARHQIWHGGGGGGGGGGTDTHKRLFMLGTYFFNLLFIFLSSPSDLLCLRSFRCKYNASTINYLLVFFYTLT